jgi:hypothetical protein
MLTVKKQPKINIAKTEDVMAMLSKSNEKHAKMLGMLAK